MRTLIQSLLLLCLLLSPGMGQPLPTYRGLQGQPADNRNLDVSLRTSKLRHISSVTALTNSRVQAAASPDPFSITYRQRYAIYWDCPYIDVHYTNNTLPSGATGTLTLKCAYDYGNQTGTMSASIPRRDMLFTDGSSSKTVAQGGWATSRIYGPFFAGDYVWIRTWMQVAGSAFYPVGAFFTQSGEGKLVGDQTQVANSSLSLSTDFARGNYGVHAITAPTTATKRACFLVGDSIFDGAGDDNAFVLGYGGRAAQLLNYGFLKVAVAGERVSTVSTQMQLRMYQADASDFAVCEYGTNDIGNGDSWQTVASNLMREWRQLKSANLKVIQTTILPKVTTTDFCVTLANQTPTAFETPRVNLNTWLRNGAQVDGSNAPVLTGGTRSPYLDLVSDVCTVAEVNSSNVLTQNGGYWLTYTPDYSGTVTSSTSTTITDTAASFAVSSNANPGDKNKYIVITSGTGIGQVKAITQVTNSTTLSISASTFSPTPPVGSTFNVIKSSSIDGTHPTYHMHMTAAGPLSNSMQALYVWP